jgi:hypothetical protein
MINWLRLIVLLAILSFKILNAQVILNNPGSNHGNCFEQLGPAYHQDVNEYRSASGAPGPKYWQQRADYFIEATLDEKNLTLYGEETIKYYNNSPDELTYLWLQLDENQHDPTVESHEFDGYKLSQTISEKDLKPLFYKENLKEYGDKILLVADEKNQPLSFTINQTMMRVDLPKPLKSKEVFTFKVKWKYKIIDRITYGGRGGYEYFPDEKNYIFTITQWYPRMCVYSDYQGWNNKQFTGRGEFALPFGNFEVKFTCPENHIVAATGTCLNYNQVLTPTQLARWNEAQNATAPIEIVTLDEAIQKEKQTTNKTKTWIFKADSVRDFALGSSPKFIWDAMPIYIEGKKVMCMSFYPKNAYTLYRKYSTKVVAHTIKTYSKYTIPYPYPVAQSVEASNGMEYPMICFNFGRTEKVGTYSESTKYGMIGVIIHEVGHNFFPMIINSDERQWTWMDEGLNTFVQFLTEQEFDNNYPSARGPAHKIVDYMRLPKDLLEPIMSNSENIINFGSNGYGKPATALNILRETILGRELFDFAFKTYAQRWAFKHPTPTDFFRTMEDASGVDLDWFWRGWFYGTDPVDIAIDEVKEIELIHLKNLPDKTDTIKENKYLNNFLHLTQKRNKAQGIQFAVDIDTSLRDYYYYNPGTNKPTIKIKKASESMEVLSNSEFEDLTKNKYFYEVTFKNIGGLVMPIIIEWTFEDGTTEYQKINAYIWRKNEKEVTKTFLKNKKVKSIKLDPNKETADINEENNYWPKQFIPSRIEVYKAKITTRGQSTGENPMQESKKKNKK